MCYTCAKAQNYVGICSSKITHWRSLRQRIGSNNTVISGFFLLNQPGRANAICERMATTVQDRNIFVNKCSGRVQLQAGEEIGLI